MTAQILASELTNLIQESKRKHADLKNVGLFPSYLTTADFIPGCREVPR
jgi:hypothetical protein